MYGISHHPHAVFKHPTKRAIVPLSLLLLAAIRSYASEVSVDELSLMTVPELAAKAEAECANIVRAKDAAAEAMRHMEEMANRGEINAGLIYSGMATDNFNEAGVHKHNLERLRLVLRNKLNGDEPTWITAYTESTSADQCTNAHTQYGEWAEAQKQKPTDAPTKKKGVPPHRTPQK